MLNRTFAMFPSPSRTNRFNGSLLIMEISFTDEGMLIGRRTLKKYIEDRQDRSCYIYFAFVLLVEEVLRVSDNMIQRFHCYLDPMSLKQTIRFDSKRKVAIRHRHSSTSKSI